MYIYTYGYAIWKHPVANCNPGVTCPTALVLGFQHEA